MLMSKKLKHRLDTASYIYLFNNKYMNFILALNKYLKERKVLVDCDVLKRR